ncbi:MAG: L-fucose/L-arabinose isomerase family protein [Clostridia bacterium]|nr:L-fucose/L-arabinose isomerase family protein [Clostridia bacterium]
MITHKERKKCRIGLFGVAHHPYWAQFPGLYESLSGFHADLVKLFDRDNTELLDLGILDDPKKALEGAIAFNAFDCDLIVCNMVTYATSSVFAPILREAKAPMILTALQPRAAMDYPRANTFMQLQNDSICSVPEFFGAAERLNRKIYDVVIGTLYNDADALREIDEWIAAAMALRALKGARVGLMGHVLNAMYDMHSDPTAIYSAFGVHVPLLEVDELIEEYHKVTEAEIEAKKALILREFDTPDPKSDPLTTRLTDTDLQNAAHASCALDRFVVTHDLDGLAYFYSGSEDTLHRLVTSSLIVGNSLLIAQGIPMCGEFDIKTCLAMLLMDAIGAGGSFAEIHPFDFACDQILVGHDGPHHVEIADGKPVLRSLKAYHGKSGKGASVEFKLKEGPITMLSINHTADGSFRFVLGEGTSNAGPIPPTGNTNTRASFAPDTKTFIKKWCMAAPTHHFALGIGHTAGILAKVAKVLDVACTVVE